MIEVRFHSRGGQGGATAAKILGMAAFLDGKYSASLAVYGAERRGAAVVAGTRISDSEVRRYSNLKSPDYVVILDPVLVEIADVTEGADAKTIFLINNRGERPAALEDFILYSVDATTISLDLGLKVAGTPVLNTPMLGALAKLGLVKQNSLKKAIRQTYSEPKNIKAADLAHERVVRVQNRRFILEESEEFAEEVYETIEEAV
ncbi:pyruvate ferredoxin oxidoreductase [Methanosarcinales archaeon]|uniref:pyruvate synthase n=1 Tax=Candidatus Syntropharchaeum caldarium TaxID=1838285 RepID=A0A1F2PBG4_9EURY|nr:MAG: pyruvate synthase [Candidatus Syntrophoarchaeum caldarius]RLG35802.1 MAG: pyruvate ferredoxin oxidoreductase [Methanosarcinales archaeon]